MVYGFIFFMDNKQTQITAVVDHEWILLDAQLEVG